MNPPSNHPPFRIWLIVRWTLGVPLVVLLILTIGVGARYASNKARLDRLKANRFFGGTQKVSIAFARVVPLAIRRLIGDERCEPFDRMSSIHFRGVTDDDLIEWNDCYDAETITIEGAHTIEGIRNITDRGLSELGKLRLLRTLEITHGTSLKKAYGPFAIAQTSKKSGL